MFLDRAKSRFTELNIENQEKLLPCTEEEISRLEQTIKHTLPLAYREFLSWMGHGAGEFWLGTHCFYEDLLKIQEWAVDLLKSNQFPGSLPDNTFVFSMHQGYEFHFFTLSQDDDPPVFSYYEPDEPADFKLAFSHYSEYFLNAIEAHQQYLDEVEQSIKNMIDSDESEGQ